jgi:hypothetical protein
MQPPPRQGRPGENWPNPGGAPPPAPTGAKQRGKSMSRPTAAGKPEEKTTSSSSV